MREVGEEVTEYYEGEEGSDDVGGGDDVPAVYFHVVSIARR